MDALFLSQPNYCCSFYPTILMKVSTSYLLILFCFLSTIANAQTFEWAVKSQNASQSNNAYGITTDAVGNVYTTGSFYETLDFDPGAGVAQMTVTGPFSTTDAYVLKLDKNGNYKWAVQIAGWDSSTGLSILSDQEDGIIVAGTFRGTADFDPDTSVYNMSASWGEDIFILKLDTLGNFVWAKRIGDSEDERVTAGAIDSIGNIYLTGEFVGSLDFDPDTSSFVLTSTNSAPYDDAFILKLDPNGTFKWVRQLTGTFYRGIKDVTVDSNGNVISAGYFNGVTDFDSGPDTLDFSSSGSVDGFVHKLDSNGVFQWAIQIGGSGNQDGESVGVDLAGNTYSTGYFNTTAQINAAGGGPTLNNGGGNDLYLLKLDTAGQVIWVKQINGDNTLRSTEMEIDDAANIYYSGYFYGTVDFDPGPGTENYDQLPGNADPFVHKLDSSGNHLWVRHMTGTGIFNVDGLRLDDDQNFHVCGRLSSQATFSPCIWTATLTGSGDYFVGKFSECEYSFQAFAPVECYSVTSLSGNHTWYTSGVYNDTIADPVCCGTIQTYMVTILDSSFGFIADTACVSYTSSNGDIWDSTGVYVETLVNAAGCDSILTIDLTIKRPSTGDTSIVACDGLSWYGSWYNSSGTYTGTDVNAEGCDSVITLDLTVISPNAFIMQGSNGLYSPVSDVDYQWFHCDSAYVPISGATDSTYVPTVSGDYAVSVEEFGCADTSSCMFVNVVGIGENPQMGTLSIYPVPSSGLITIQCGGQNAAYRILDLLGREVVSGSYLRTGENRIELEEVGVYFLEAETENGVQVVRFVIQD